MAGGFFQISSNNWGREIQRARREHQTMRRRAARFATDKKSKDARQGIVEGMRGAGLGKLGGAVGQQSALKKGTDGLWGVIYARGQANPDDRGAGALEAYTQGTVIRGKWGNWLAIATNALPKMTMARGRRRRMTPFIYQTSGWQSKLGPLEFRPIGVGRALLVVKRVTLSPKTGRARRAGKRPSRTRVNVKEVVAFILIRQTARAKRYDHKQEVLLHAKQVPDEMVRYIANHFPSAPRLTSRFSRGI